MSAEKRVYYALVRPCLGPEPNNPNYIDPDDIADLMLSWGETVEELQKERSEGLAGEDSELFENVRIFKLTVEPMEPGK
jgi:hypothetical protein